MGAKSSIYTHPSTGVALTGQGAGGFLFCPSTSWVSPHLYPARPTPSNRQVHSALEEEAQQYAILEGDGWYGHRPCIEVALHSGKGPLNNIYMFLVHDSV